MQSSNIIELIDAYLERLLEARQLLADFAVMASRDTFAMTSSVSPAKSVVKRELRSSKRQGGGSRPEIQKTPKRNSQKLKKEVGTTAPAEDRDVPPSLISDVQQPAVELLKLEIKASEKSVHPQIVPIIRSRPSRSPRKKVATKKPPVNSSSLALSGNIPTGPVVVHADQIRQEQSLRQRALETKAKDPYQSSVDVPLTAELLSQRWKQGAQRLNGQN